MTREVFAGAIYGDALPTGERVVVFPSRNIQTHTGTIAFPEGEHYGVLYPVLSADGTKFVAQGHDQPVTHEFIGGAWKLQPPSNGTYGHVYDLQGNLHIIAPGPNVTSQGYRYVAPDGTLVMGDDTYTPKNGVSQWTDIGGIIIGQGHDDNVSGVVLWDGFHLRRIDTGFCWPVRVRWTNDKVTLIYTRSGEGVIIRQTTKEELRALPIVGTVTPNPGTPTTPAPAPPTMSTPNRLELAQQIAAQHPELVKLNTSEACGILTEYIAVALHASDANWGLLSKSPGENQYRGHAIDAVIYKPTNQVIDLMSGAGDRDPHSGVPANQQFDIRVKWEEVAVKRPSNNWMAPIVPVDAGSAPSLPSEPIPSTPSPNETAVALASIMLALGDLRKAVEEFAGEQKETAAMLDRRLTAIEHPVFPKYKGTNRFLGTITFEPQ